MVTIGVLGVQGAVSEHIEAFRKLKADSIWLKTPSQLSQIDGIVIPGGESTTISRLMQQEGLFERVQQMGKDNFPIWGTCAGLILLAKKGDSQVQKTKTKLLSLMDIEVNRNAFGRQKESFEKDIIIKGIKNEKKLFPCVFIRAPAITKTFGKCEALAQFNNFTIAARQKNLLATAFHPELTSDLRIHEYFLQMM